MYQNESNPAQLNTFETNAISSNLSRIESVQNITGNLKLRAGLIIADSAQKLIRPGLNSNKPPNFTKQIEETRKLQQQSVKSFGEIEKAQKKAFEAFDKQIPKSLDDFGKKTKGILEPTKTLIGDTRKAVAGLENSLEKLATVSFISKGIEILVNGFSRINDEIKLVSSSVKVLNKSGFDPALLKSINDFESSITSLDFSNTEEFATSFVAQYSQVTEALAQVGTLIPDQLKKAANEGRSALSDLFDDVQNMVNGTLKNTVSSSEAIAATYTALQAGIGGGNDASDPVIKDTVQNTLKLIAAQGGDANQVMELLAQTMTAFNMSANSSGEILGKLNELVNVGITTIPELAQGFGQLGVGASAAGLDLDELTIGMAALTKSGSNTFSAMTGLQNLFNKISSGTVTERLAEMGVTLNDNAVRFDTASVSAKGFVNSVKELNVALGGNSEKIQEALGGDQEALRAIRGFLKTTNSDLENIVNTISNAGAKNLEDAFNIKIDNDKILQFEQVLNRISEIALKLGKILAPLFSKGLERIEKNIDRIQYLTNNYGNLIIKLVEFNLTMKVASGVIGAFIGTVFKLTGAYAGWLLLSGRLIGNLGKIWKMLADQNKTLNQNNLLWDKNASIFSKIFGVIGQLLGVYDLENAGKIKITKEQEKQIKLEAKQRALQAASHKQVMENLQKEEELYKKINNIREGKSQNNLQNIFNNDKLLKDDNAELQKREEKLRQEIRAIAPTDDKRQEKLKELTETQKKIQTNNEILDKNNQKLARFEELQQKDQSGVSKIDSIRASVRELEEKDPQTLSRSEKIQLNKNRKTIRNFDDIELAKRAKDYNQDDELNYRKAVATKKYLEENQDKPGFKREVKRQEKAEQRRAVGEIKPLSEGILGQNNLTAGFADFIDQIRDAPAVFKELSEETSKLKESFKKNIKDIVKGSGELIKSTFTTEKGLKNLTLGVTGVALALGGAAIVELEKNAQRARDLLAEAGLDKNDKDILSPIDALKKQLIDFGSWLTESLTVSFKWIRKAFGTVVDFIVRGILSIPKLIVQLDHIFRNTWANLINFIIDKVKEHVPALGFLEGFKFDTKEMKKNQDEQLKALDDFGNKLTKKMTEPLDNASNAFTNFVSNVTYAVTQANEDIARAKIRNSIDENNTLIDSLGRKLSGLNNISSTGSFSDVDIVVGKDKKGEDITEKTNLSTTLKNMLVDVDISSLDVEKFRTTALKTQEKLKQDYQDYEELVKRNQTANQTLRNDLVKGIGLEEGQEDEVFNSLVQKKLDVEVSRLKGDTKAKLDPSTMSEKEKTLNNILTKEQNDKINVYLSRAAKTEVDLLNANTYNKNLNDLSKVITSLQSFVQNRKDIGTSNNPDASRAVLGLDSTVKLLGKGVENFAQTLSTISNSKYSQDELVNLAKESPEEYAKIVKSSGVDFTSAGTVFSEVQKQIPTIIEQLQQNAEMGYISDEERKAGVTVDTSKAERFEKILDEQITSKFKNAGFTQDQANNFKDSLLADQKIREQIFALEKDDYDKRMERLSKEKEMYEITKQSELLITKDILEKSQKLEQKRLEESINFTKKRIDTLKKGSDNLDPQIIKDAETDLKKLEQKLIIERIEQKKEMLSYETKLITDAYEKRYAEIQEQTLKGERKTSELENIDLESNKQQEILKLNLQTQTELRKILQKEGKLNKENSIYIDKQIQQARVELLNSYVSEATSKYTFLGERIQRNVEIEINGINAVISRLGVKSEIYDKINAIVEQQNSVFQTGQNSLERDANYLRENLRNRRAQIKFEKDYFEQRKKALVEQLGFERESLNIQKEQNRLLLERLRREQEIREKTAKVGVEKAVINLKKAEASGDNFAVYDAQKDLEIAELDYKTAIMNRENIKLEEARIRNENAIKEYEFKVKEQQAFEDLERDRAKSTRTRIDDNALVRKGLKRFETGDYILPPELDKPSVNTEARENDAQAEIVKIKENLGVLTQPITKELKNNSENIDKTLTTSFNKLSDFAKEYKILTEKLIKNQDELVNSQVKNFTDLTNNLTKTQNELYRTHTKEIQGQFLEFLNNLPQKPTNKTKSTENITIEKVINNTMREMLNLSGINLDDLSEKILPKIKFSNKLEKNAGGLYNFDNNTLEIDEKYKESIENLDEEGMRILVHELRHWMQDEKLNKGWLNPTNIKDSEKRSWVEKEGIPFSGNNKEEKDAYAYDAENTSKIIDKLARNIKTSMSTMTEKDINKQTTLQEKLVKYVEKLYDTKTTKLTDTVSKKASVDRIVALQKEEEEYPGGKPNADWTKEQYYDYQKWVRERNPYLTMTFADPEAFGITKSKNSLPELLGTINRENPNIKYENILSSLKTKENVVDKLNSESTTNNNNSKNVNVSLAPRIEITIEKDADKNLAQNTAQEINKQLFTIFNEVAYKI